jgi:CRP/FNR family transcriptional regulator, cyclic AMP receptor protein
VKHDDHAKEAIRRVRLFADLDDRAIGRVAGQTTSHRFAAGDSVIDAETSGRFGRLYMIVSGTAEARVNGEPVATFGPGDYFGEMSVLDGSPRSATVVATSDMQTFGLSSWNMRSLLREEPDVALHIIATLAQRLRSKNEDLTD